MEQPSVDNFARVGIGIATGHPDAGADRFPFRSAPQYRDRKRQFAKVKSASAPGAKCIQYWQLLQPTAPFPHKFVRQTDFGL